MVIEREVFESVRIPKLKRRKGAVDPDVLFLSGQWLGWRRSRTERKGRVTPILVPFFRN